MYQKGVGRMPKGESADRAQFAIVQTVRAEEIENYAPKIKLLKPNCKTDILQANNNIHLSFPLLPGQTF